MIDCWGNAEKPGRYEVVFVFNLLACFAFTFGPVLWALRLEAI